MKREILNYLESKSNLYVNVHRDKFLNETEKAYIVEIDENTAVFIPKTFVLEKNKMFSYVRIYIDKNNQYCLSNNQNLSDRDYTNGLDVFLMLLKTNQKLNKFSTVYQVLVDMDKHIFV